MLSHSFHVVRHSVRLVHHDELPRKAGRPSSQVIVVEDGVAVLLRIRDPDDGVHAWQELVDACAVLGRRRVDIRQVEDRHIAEAAGVVIAYLAHAEPFE